MIPLDSGPEVMGPLLRQAHQRAAKAFATALRPLGIEGRHFGVMTTLASRGALTQSQLIAALHGEKSAMLRTVDDLERLGLAVRHDVPGDRRARAVGLTPAGHERLSAARKIAQDVGADLFACLSDEEQATLFHLLKRFVAARDS